MRDRVSAQVEPHPTPVGVPPSLSVRAFRILAEEQVATPSCVVAFQRWPRDTSGAAAVELAGRSWATPGAMDLHHGVAVP